MVPLGDVGTETVELGVQVDEGDHVGAVAQALGVGGDVYGQGHPAAQGSRISIGTDMAQAHEAQEAIFDAVIETLEKAKNNSGTTRSAMLRDAGIAYRAAVGGPQPGSVVVESK